MAALYPLPESFRDWLAGRPPLIREMAAGHPPNLLYRMGDGHRVTIYSYAEDGTVTVNVTGQFNRVLFSRQVFGVKIEDLEECDLPSEGEDLGDTSDEAGYTDDDVRDILIPMLRGESDA